MVAFLVVLSGSPFFECTAPGKRNAKTREIAFSHGDLLMHDQKRGGLSGKARQVRSRHRVARLYANQLLAEYLEPHDTALVDPHGGRWIPIKRRSEFLPSIQTATHHGETSSRRRPRGSQPGSPPAASRRHHECAPTESGGSGTLGPAIRFPTVLSPFPEESPVAGTRRRGSPPFSVGGFVFGCAMGTTAALLVLLFLRAAFS